MECVTQFHFAFAYESPALPGRDSPPALRRLPLVEGPQYDSSFPGHCRKH